METMLIMLVTAIISCGFFSLGYLLGKKEKPIVEAKELEQINEKTKETEDDRAKMKKVLKSFKNLMNYTEDVAVRGYENK